MLNVTRPGFDVNHVKKELWPLDKMQAYLCSVKTIRPILSPDSNRCVLSFIMLANDTWLFLVELAFLNSIKLRVEMANLVLSERAEYSSKSDTELNNCVK